VTARFAWTLLAAFIAAGPRGMLAGQAPAPEPEHPVVKAIAGATVRPGSKTEEHGRLPVSYRDGKRSVSREVEGRYWLYVVS
jgi:hypothetical protein